MYDKTLKTKPFFLSKIDEEPFQKFAELLYEHDGNIHIFLESGGGSVSHKYAFLDLINENAHRIKITSVRYIYSAAFTLFVMAKCEKVVTNETIGMLHLPRFEKDIFTNGKFLLEGHEKKCLQNSQDDKESIEKILKSCSLSNKQTKQFHAGHDLHFTTNEIREIIQKYNEI
jgi:ATP-dependent protease ClpP protease subunit